ncbi:MAG: preprotein translocase subunit YajC [Prolixibacteraceae bacterium]|jgi:preprotein translocase subunit YajC|nr:preprotein translocase subunit YajC [Prolixibacteraceae bacterium]
MSTLLFVIAQQQTQQGMLGMFLPLVLIIVVFYFFMIRPQMKRQKETQKFRDALQRGDKVVTSGGIYGRIDEIKDQIIYLEVAPNIKLKVDKSVVLKDMTDAPVAK